MVKKLKNLNGESLVLIISMAFGLIWAVNGVKLGLWAKITPGPGLFPFVIGIMLVLFSLKAFLASLREMDESEKMSSREKKVLLFCVVMSVTCAISLNIFGVFVTLILGLLAWFKLYARYSWRKTLICVVCIIASTYLIFVTWLAVPFPKFLDIF